ncbi:protein prune homolog 2 [Anopheles maculipalpis]|uniref:protein prune homolog 2 n=1 Tax=Anopheles maculipalpis TaxID=1496333 RepID=UPI002158A301|nr:protein prune homolog 2 [Anopheles maculipalpis]
MSESLEDSPLSDNRMDISENTTSHGSSPPLLVESGSPDYSPVHESDGITMKQSLLPPRCQLDTELGNGVEPHTDARNTTTGDAATESIEIHKLSANKSPSIVTSRVTSSTGLTPVSNHPLMMSPTGSESDVSELIVDARTQPAGCHREPTVRNYYHYPDVVPASEQPLRLASPYANRRGGEKKADGSMIVADEKRAHVAMATTPVRRFKGSPAKRMTVGVDGSKAGAATSTLDVINYAIHRGVENDPNDGVSPVRQRAAEEIGSDFFSTESEGEDPYDEEDVSLFQASVTPTFKSVALHASPPQSDGPSPTGGQPRKQKQHSKSISPRLHQRRKVPLPSDLLVDDVSSMEDTLSNQSVDELQQNLVSLSPSSSILDDNGFNVDIDEDFLDLPGTPKATGLSGDVSGLDAVAAAGRSTTLPQYSAREEARDIRNWQKITLPDGKTREIDMKVIEPYKCVLSHGGYLQAGGHNAIVVFSACHLPDRSRADYHYVMNNLFLYVVKTLEQLVTEDYVLVYLHGGSSRGNVPPFPWLKKCYQLLDRRLRKSLRNLYMVHPTFWLKSVVWMARPFISSKFWRKLVYVTSLEELYKLVPVEKAAVPDKVKNYNAR